MKIFPFEISLADDHFSLSLLHSIFSLCSPEELEESLKQWRQKIDDRTADRFIKESDEVRQRIGTSISVVAYKQGS